MEDTRDLGQVRADIDAIDKEIQALISRRAQCARLVAYIKLAEVSQAYSVARDRKAGAIKVVLEP